MHFQSEIVYICKIEIRLNPNFFRIFGLSKFFLNNEKNNNKKGNCK